MVNSYYTFDQMALKVKDLRARTIEVNNRPQVQDITVNGRTMKPSPRFFTSLFARFGLSKGLFRYYSHDEVFERVSERHANDNVILTVECHPDRPETMLAVRSPSAIAVDHDTLIPLLAEYGIDVDNADYGQKFPVAGGSIDPNGVRIGNIGGSQHDAQGNLMSAPRLPDLSYDCGIIRSIHRPQNSNDFTIAGDEFSNRFVMDTPLDGYGQPSLYLMLLRQICANGSIGYSRTFRADVKLGKKEDSFEYAMRRAFEGYNNDEGFQALRERYESAAKSWASIAEINKVYKTLVKVHAEGEARVADKYLGSDKSGTDGAALMDHSPLITSFHKLVGDLTRTYGLANLDALGVKRQRTLPSGCTMYTLLNFVSEVATHHTQPAGARRMHALTGDFLSAEMDLEGTFDKFPNWTDLLISDEASAETYQMAKKA